MRSFSIGSCNRVRTSLETTLQSIQAQTIGPAAFEVLVANDGADREIRELCAAMTVKELVLPHNRGSYAARNKALQHSTGEFIAFVDADVKVDPNWAAAGVAALRTNDLAAGRTVIDVSKRRAAVELYLYCFAYPNQRHVERLHMAQTVNLFSRREVFSQIGFFDERLRSGGDLEWTLRATSKGKKLLAYSDHAVAYHPARSYRQILGSRKRILYGQIAASEMHPDKAGAMCRATNAPYRLLLPPSYDSLRLMTTLGLTPIERLKVYAFAWWLKLRSFVMLLGIANRAHCIKEVFFHPR